MINTKAKYVSLILSIVFLTSTINAQPPYRKPDDSKGFRAHDPVMIKQDKTYYA